MVKWLLLIMITSTVVSTGCRGAPEQVSHEDHPDVSSQEEMPGEDMSKENLVEACEKRLTQRLDGPTEDAIEQIRQYCQKHYGLIVNSAESTKQP